MTNTCRVKRDRTIHLLSASLLILALSLVLPVLSNDTYCHNLRLAYIFAVASVVILLMLFFGSQATSTRTRIASGVGEAISISATLLNLASIAAAADLCKGR